LEKRKKKKKISREEKMSIMQEKGGGDNPASFLLEKRFLLRKKKAKKKKKKEGGTSRVRNPSWAKIVTNGLPYRGKKGARGAQNNLVFKDEKGTPSRLLQKKGEKKSQFSTCEKGRKRRPKPSADEEGGGNQT